MARLGDAWLTMGIKISIPRQSAVIPEDIPKPRSGDVRTKKKYGVLRTCTVPTKKLPKRSVISTWKPHCTMHVPSTSIWLSIYRIHGPTI